MDVQTRGNGECLLWPTIAAAFEAAEKDSSIWKISWDNKETNERVRLVRSTGGILGDLWVYSPILINVDALSEKEANEIDEELFPPEMKPIE
jgi:hypothetical protein